MRKGKCLVLTCLLSLSIGCQGLQQETEPQDTEAKAIQSTGPNEQQKRAFAEHIRKHPEAVVKVQPWWLVGQVRTRLPDLKPGMTEAQVLKVLNDLPLGEEIVVSRTISGGKTVQYVLSPHQRLELTFLPQSLAEPRPGGLIEAKLIE